VRVIGKGVEKPAAAGGGTGPYKGTKTESNSFKKNGGQNECEHRVLFLRGTKLRCQILALERHIFAG
jgi:hypothetical protein